MPGQANPGHFYCAAAIRCHRARPIPATFIALQPLAAIAPGQSRPLLLRCGHLLPSRPANAGHFYRAAAIHCHCAWPIPVTFIVLRPFAAIESGQSRPPFFAPHWGISIFIALQPFAAIAHSQSRPPFIAPHWGIPIFIALQPFAAIVPSQSRPPFVATRWGIPIFIALQPFAAIAPGQSRPPFIALHQGIPIFIALRPCHLLPSRQASYPGLLLIAPRPFYAPHWGIPICLSRQGQSTPRTGALPFAHPAKAIAYAVRPSLFYHFTVMVCFYQAWCCWALICQESSSFTLLGTQSSLSPEHSYCYRAKAAICCSSSLSLAMHAPFFWQRFLWSRKPSATILLLPFCCK